MDESELPLASSLERFVNDSEYTGGIWVMVNIDLAKLKVKVKRVNITMPENLLHEIDRYAEQYHMTRSGLNWPKQQENIFTANQPDFY